MAGVIIPSDCDSAVRSDECGDGLVEGTDGSVIGYVYDAGRYVTDSVT